MAEQTMTFQEFRRSIQTAPKDRSFKVTNSLGVYDVYKRIRKNHWFDIGRPVTEKEFYAIIRSVNKLLAENIANGETVRFPEKMGTLELRKFSKGVSIVNGQLKNTYPIDWMETMRLWYQDEEEHKKKTLIRREETWVYQAKYCKDKATYENKQFYQFALNKFIKNALKENIQSGKIDALW